MIKQAPCLWCLQEIHCRGRDSHRREGKRWKTICHANGKRQTRSWDSNTYTGQYRLLKKDYRKREKEGSSNSTFGYLPKETPNTN